MFSDGPIAVSTGNAAFLRVWQTIITQQAVSVVKSWLEQSTVKIMNPEIALAGITFAISRKRDGEKSDYGRAPRNTYHSNIVANFVQRTMTVVVRDWRESIHLKTNKMMLDEMMIVRGTDH